MTPNQPTLDAARPGQDGRPGRCRAAARGGLLLAATCAMLLAGGAGAAESRARTLPERLQDWREPGQGHWRLAFSPFTHHWSFDEQHRPVYALALERQRVDGWLAGASHFRNSFGQPSAYVYMGWRSASLAEIEPLFWQWSAGVLYGYRGEFSRKVPLNAGGFSPGALLSLGWQANRRSSVLLHALGDAGVMLQWSWDVR
jgi:hypothetical protein